MSRRKPWKGGYKNRFYRKWREMMRRCYNPRRPGYKNYGGRGISVCEEWRVDPWNFIRWAEGQDWCLGLSLDRIDNDGDYTPKNCRFATDKQQANNRRARQRTLEGIAAHSAAVSISNVRRLRNPAWRSKLRRLGKKLSENYARLTPEQRSENTRRGWSSQTIEQRKERIRKMLATRLERHGY